MAGVPRTLEASQATSAACPATKDAKMGTKGDLDVENRELPTLEDGNPIW